MSKSIAVALVIAGLAVAGAATPAAAATGVITGYLRFEQLQGNFCPVGRSCTGARYLEAEYSTYQRIKDVKVYIKNNANGAIVGQGSTDSNGVYLIQWTSSSSVSSATIYWVSENADGRFYITDLNGTKRQFNAYTAQALTSGTTVGSPQDLGQRGWGGASSSTVKIANINDGAWRMWNDGLSWSSLMANEFTGL